MGPGAEIVRALVPAEPEILREEFETFSADGTPIVLRWYSPASTFYGPPVVYVHGGGLITGDLDFCHEDVRYAGGLLAAGVNVELHVRPGLVHGFELLGPDAAQTIQAFNDRFRVLRAL